jgi:hypothetical protein
MTMCIRGSRRRRWAVRQELHHSRREVRVVARFVVDHGELGRRRRIRPDNVTGVGAGARRRVRRGLGPGVDHRQLIGRHCTWRYPRGRGPGRHLRWATPRHRLSWRRWGRPRVHRPGQSGRPGARRRPGLVRPVAMPLLRADRESEPRPLGIAHVDALAVVDVDDGHPVTVDVGPVQRAVVDGQPAALIEAQDQVRARDPRVRDAQVGMLITSDDNLMTCCEGSLGPVVPNCQHGGCGAGHYSSIGEPPEWSPWDSPVTSALFQFGHA